LWNNRHVRADAEGLVPDRTTLRGKILKDEDWVWDNFAAEWFAKFIDRLVPIFDREDTPTTAAMPA